MVGCAGEGEGGMGWGKGAGTKGKSVFQCYCCCAVQWAMAGFCQPNCTVGRQPNVHGAGSRVLSTRPHIAKPERMWMDGGGWKKVLVKMQPRRSGPPEPGCVALLHP